MILEFILHAHQYFRVHRNRYSEQAEEVLEHLKAQLIESCHTVGDDDESREVLEEELSCNTGFWKAIHDLRQEEGKPFYQLKVLKRLLNIISDEQLKVAESLSESIAESLQHGEFEE